MRRLSVKQEKFICSYVQTGNATQSAIAAGYSPKTARVIASLNLTKVDILARKLELEAQINSPKIADVKERKESATEVIREAIKVPVTAKERILAISELNKMEHIYEIKPEVSIDNRQVNIYVMDGETKELLSRVKERTGKLIGGGGAVK